MKYCTMCGKELEDDTKFCTGCGAKCTETEGAQSNYAAPVFSQDKNASGINPVSQDEPYSPPPKKEKKRISKGKGILIAALCGVLIVGIAAGVLFLRWYNSTEQQVLRALKSADYEAALEIVDEDEDVRESEKMEALLKDRIEEVKSGFAAGTIEYASAIAELDAIASLNIDGLSSAADSARDDANALNASRTSFAAAEAFYESGDYADAIANYRLVIQEDANYSAATKQLEASEAKYAEAILSDVAEQMETGLYSDAIALLEKALKIVPDNTALTEQLGIVEAERAEKGIAGALLEAEEAAKAGDYTSALAILADAQDSYGSSSELKEKQQEYESAFAEETSAQIDAYLLNNDISAAKALLQDALKIIPESKLLESLQEELDAYKTVSLSSLTPINGGFTWNEGTPEDPFGNTYSNAQNYTILHGKWSCEYTETYSAEYKVDGRYDLLSFVVSPYSDFGESRASYVQVYVNDVLRYTTPEIQQKTQPFQIPAVDISDAEYIKIVVHVGSYGCVMLSDAVLNSSPAFVSSLETGFASLSALEVFNGSLPWENEFPKDARGNDYSTAQNYAVLHGKWSCEYAQTYSAEYYVAQKYQTISLDIAPAADFGENGSAYVKIYAGESLVYTSPNITQKTTKFHTGDINISGMDYVKLVVEVNGYSCTIISNVLLKNAQ